MDFSFLSTYDFNTTLFRRTRSPTHLLISKYIISLNEVHLHQGITYAFLPCVHICGNGLFILKMRKTKQSPGILDLCLTKTQSGRSRDYRDVIVFEKLRFKNVFRPQENTKPAFSNSSGLKSVFEKLRFGVRLVWTVDLSVEIKLRFQISLA